MSAAHAVKLSCQRASCDACLVSNDVGEAIKTAVEGGWRHDGWGWWCAQHLPVSDTLPSASSVSVLEAP